MINLCTKVHKKFTMEPMKSLKSRLINPNFSKYKETNYNKNEITKKREELSSITTKPITQFFD